MALCWYVTAAMRSGCKNCKWGACANSPAGNEARQGETGINCCMKEGEWLVQTGVRLLGRDHLGSSY